MACAPKLLTPAWTKMFETENTDSCTPAGRPTCSTRFRYLGCRRMLSIRSLSGPSSWSSVRNTSAAEVKFARVVASATPATLILKTTTNSRFRMTFRMPAKIMYISGRFVSPMERRIAAPKL